MTGWDAVPVFGQPPETGAVVRPSAYGLVTDGSARLAIVRTPQGRYLPGGGIEPGESVHDAVVREVREECGLDVRTGAWSTRAVDFVYSITELTHFEKRSTFVEASVFGPPVSSIELDHDLEWMPARDAIASLAHPSHRWAVAQWAARSSTT
jgi:8-oxo-dGTP diphosphatase